MNNKVILITPQELNNLIEKSIRNVLNEKKDHDFEKRLFSRNQTATIFNIHASTLNKKIKAGLIGTTPDGKHITGKEINRYLKQNTEEPASV